MAGNLCLHITLHSFEAVSEEIGTSLAVTRASGTSIIKCCNHLTPDTSSKESVRTAFDHYLLVYADWTRLGGFANSCFRALEPAWTTDREERIE